MADLTLDQLTLAKPNFEGTNAALHATNRISILFKQRFLDQFAKNVAG